MSVSNPVTHLVLDQLNKCCHKPHKITRSPMYEDLVPLLEKVMKGIHGLNDLKVKVLRHSSLDNIAKKTLKYFLSLK